MANRGAVGVLLRTNKKGRRSAPEGPHYCNTCKKDIKAEAEAEAEVARREAERRAAAFREEDN